MHRAQRRQHRRAPRPSSRSAPTRSPVRNMRVAEVVLRHRRLDQVARHSSSWRTCGREVRCRRTSVVALEVDVAPIEVGPAAVRRATPSSMTRSHVRSSIASSARPAEHVQQPHAGCAPTPCVCLATARTATVPSRRARMASATVAGLGEDVGEARLRCGPTGRGRRPRTRARSSSLASTDEASGVDRRHAALMELLGGTHVVSLASDRPQVSSADHIRARRGGRRPQTRCRSPTRRAASRPASSGAANDVPLQTREAAAEVVRVDRLPDPAEGGGPRDRLQPALETPACVLITAAPGCVGAHPGPGVAEQRVACAVGVERADRDDRQAVVAGRPGTGRRRRSTGANAAGKRRPAGRLVAGGADDQGPVAARGPSRIAYIVGSKSSSSGVSW